MPSKEAWTWSRAQWGEVELGDERRQGRAVAVGAALAEASARSIPQQLQSRAAAKATYRLMDCEEVTHAALIEPHRQATRQAAQACGQKPVLFVQDGSCLDFTHRNSLEGVGRIGNDRGQGFCLHSCLALEAQSGVVLGLADQRFWARTEPARAESRTQRARRRTQADVWAESLEAIGPVADGATWVSVADRGADVYSHLYRARALGWHCLIRACQDRALAEGGHLLQQVRALAPRSQRTVRVGPKRRQERVLQLAWCAVQLTAPAPEGGRRPGLATRTAGGVGHPGLGRGAGMGVGEHLAGRRCRDGRPMPGLVWPALDHRGLPQRAQDGLPPRGQPVAHGRELRRLAGFADLGLLAVLHDRLARLTGRGSGPGGRRRAK